jgi:hypothetical protein
MAEWLMALEASSPAVALRGSVWIYPAVNAVHILGIALLVGAILPLDLRLLGWWPKTSLAVLWQVLTRTAATGLGMATVSGALLFITRATEYSASGLFVAKMGVVCLATTNALLLHSFMMRRRPEMEGASMGVRIAAGISLIAWITALILGRLVGYF